MPLHTQRRSEPNAVPAALEETRGEAGDDDNAMLTMQLAADSFELELAGDDLQLFNNMAAGLLGSPRFTLGASAGSASRVRVRIIVRAGSRVSLVAHSADSINLDKLAFAGSATCRYVMD